MTVSALLDRGRGTGLATGATVSVISVIPAASQRDSSLSLPAAERTISRFAAGRPWARLRLTGPCHAVLNSFVDEGVYCPVTQIPYVYS
ncbi:hypothetical protein ABIC07_003463 [Bradyrhizobium sp. RT9a]